MNFFYKAKDKQGEEHQGVIESVDLHTAVLLLRKRGLVVISVTPKAESGDNFLARLFDRVSFSELVTMTRQLATMVSAGLTLSESVDILEEQQTNKKLKKILGEISNDIKGGFPFALSLSRHKDIFPPLYINLVKSGEASGKLDEVLLKMADSLEKDREFRARVRGALIYPIVVVSMMVAVVIIMMTFVIPKLTSLYKESTLDLPLPTKILIATSNLFINYWWVMLALLIVSIIALKRWAQTPQGRFALDRLYLRIPIVGKVITNVTLTTSTRTFGLLTAAGIPLLESINIVENVTQNSVFKQALKESYSGVERGLNFSAQLLSLPVFPKIVGQMVRVGEETGKVDEIFYKLSEYFESESDHLVKNLTVAIEPIILIVLGIGVTFLVLSIILPIYKLTTSF
ncbi:type II secretion system F family protein [Candidatus Daviesbacteria bacterium]|nr:type II secretion system F family protein [Candidatus Daviesbacteria bacterium]